MNTNLMLLGLFKWFYLSILFVVFCYGCYHFIRTRLKKQYNQDTLEMGGTIVIAALILSAAAVIYPTSDALSQAFQLFSKQATGSQLALKLIQFTGYTLIISLANFLLLLMISSITTRILHRESYLEVASKNDIPGSVLFAVVIVCLAILSIDSVTYMLDALLPYPALPGFR
jgi:hypothetical protein